MKKYGFLFSLPLLMAGLSAENNVQPVKTYRSQASECDHMSRSEMQFADLLSLMQKKVFCSIFNDQQRDHAMEMFHTGKGTMSADEAVEKVISLNSDPEQNQRSIKEKSSMEKMDKPESKSNKQSKRAYYY